jgi:hypothetical protein
METQTSSQQTLKSKQQINKLKFYQDEIVIMRKRLSEAVMRNTNREVLVMVDHFDNQFDIQEKVISDLKHKLKSLQHLNIYQNHLNNSPLLDDDVDGSDDVETFEKHFNNLRNEYINFLTKWM